jgi:hypothetical protein
VSDVHLKAPQQLYEDWEHSHWAAQDVDLARDPPTGALWTRTSAGSCIGF